jgi:uncharacterized protein (TIGR02284 family)
MEHRDAIKTLNGLIEICKDGEKGYRLAADKEKDTELSLQFRRYSNERGQFVTQLKEEVRILGGDPEQSGTVLGAIHRGWIETKSTATGNDTEAIVAECERGEDAAKHAYEDALKKNLPESARLLVLRQYERVIEAHDRMRELELQLKH